MAAMSYVVSCFMSKNVILLKRPYISPKIAPRGSECETTCRKLWPGNLFQVLNLAFDPCFKVKSGHHTKTTYFSHFVGAYFSRFIGAIALECIDRP